MEVEIQSDRENALLSRREVRFVVHHEAEATPTREVVREGLEKALKLKEEVLVLDHLRSEFGRSRSKGYAKVYGSMDDARRMERRHILRRNGLGEESS